MSIEAQLGDLHQINTHDGKVFTVPDEEAVFKAYGGYGAPPVEYITRRGYKQDGVTEIDFTIASRSVSITLYRVQSCTRMLYWQKRAELHDLLRPNRGGQLTLVLRQPNGAKRALKVRANPGAVFGSQPDTNSWNIDEPIDFVAFDPFWFDPTTVIEDVALTIDSSLIFPITFPITFGLSGAQFSYNVAYTGTWKAFPTLTLTGPYTSAEIVNLQTGVKIALLQGVSNGEQRIISLKQGEQSIVDASGVNKFSDLSPDSDLINFAIFPDPEVEDGIQTIRAILQGAQVYTGTGWKVETQILAPNRWYRNGEPSGTTMVDSGADAANGTYSNVTLAAGGAIPADSDTSASFNGTTSIATFPPCEFQAISYSINVWGYFTTLATNPVIVGVDGGTISLGQEIAIGVSAAGALLFYAGGGTIYSSANGLITTNTFYMLTFTYDRPNTRLRGYINGVQVINTAAGDFLSATPACYLGGYGVSNRMSGRADETQIWLGHILLQAELDALYASRLVASRTYTPSGFRVEYNTRYFAI